ncbi:hypothetical protein M011DRAFT_457062 [Sporormia fimetaria CBS 119925]|uniref:Stc1 domain-containing protein n=1 Tax=Sporormia fimetaria CBS 119925 TaxID=1340428 RepID=A0A6A6VE94_9PLEO|nr:hypothetical protein M011DRAFT_457062 [Sporormia fimetaria CBS 119925]
MPNKNKKKYDPERDRRLKGVKLPPKIKCSRCEKYRPAPAFSHNQLNDAREAIYNRGQRAVYHIRCLACVGAQVVEIECTICKETKGMEDYSKVQRAKPDQAKCWECVEKQLEVEPVDTDAYVDPHKIFTPVEAADDEDYPEYWTSTAAPSEVDEWNPEGSTGGVSLAGTFSRLSMAPSKSTSTNSGLLIDSDFTDQSVSSSQNFGSTMTERSNTHIKASGWAKVKAYKPEKAPAVADDDWESSSSSDAGDDDDDDEDFEI